MAKSKLGIGEGKNPFSKPATEKPTAPGAHRLFPHVLKKDAGEPETPANTWVPPLTRIEQPAGQGLDQPTVERPNALSRPEHLVSSSAVYDMVESKTSSAEAIRPPLFSDSFSTTRDQQVGREHRYLSVVRFNVYTLLDTNSRQAQALMSAGERHGVIVRLQRSGPALHVDVRPTAETLGEGDQQLNSFANAIGKPVEIVRLKSDDVIAAPDTPPEVLTLRSAARRLGITGASIELKKKRRFSPDREASLKIPIVLPDESDQVAKQRFDDALQTMSTALRRLGPDRPPAYMYSDTQSSWMLKGITTDMAWGKPQGAPYLLLEATDRREGFLATDVQARLPSLLQHWGILPDTFSSMPQTSLEGIGTLPLPADKSFAEILNAETSFPVFTAEGLSHQFDTLFELLDKMTPQALQQNVDLGTYDQTPFIRRAVTRALQESDPSSWASQKAAIERAKQRAIDLLQRSAFADPSEIDRFAQQYSQSAAFDRFLAGLVYLTAIEPRREAHQHRHHLLVRAYRWDEAMRPLTATAQVLASSPQARTAVDLALLNFGIQSSFDFDRTKYATASRLVSSPATPHEPLTPKQAASALDVLGVTTDEELDGVVTRKEQELEKILGVSLQLLRQIAAEAERGDAVFYDDLGDDPTALVQPQTSIGDGQYLFSRPATAPPPHQPLFPQFLKMSVTEAEAAVSTWVPPLTRIENAASAEPPRDRLNASSATNSEPSSVAAKKLPRVEPVQGLFDESFKLRSLKTGRENHYLTVITFQVVTSHDATAPQAQALIAVAQQHGARARIKQAAGALYVDVRPNATTLGQGAEQLHSFAQALGNPIGVSTPAIGQIVTDPRSPLEVMAIRAAVRELGITEATIDIQKKRPLSSDLHASIKIPVILPDEGDHVAKLRFDEAMQLMRTVLRRLNSGRNFGLHHDTESSWVLQGVKTDTTWGRKRGTPFLLLEVTEKDEKRLFSDAQAKLPSLFQHWGILPEAASVMAEEIPTDFSGETSSSFAQILTADTSFPVFSADALTSQFDALLKLFEQNTPEVLQQNLTAGSYRQTPFIHGALTRALRATDSKSWAAQKADIETAKQVAIEELQRRPQVDPAELDRFAQQSSQGAAFDRFLAGLVFSTAIEPRREAHRDRNQLLNLAHKWDEEMRPLTATTHVMQSDPLVREAVALYLLEQGLQSSFEFDRNKYATAARKLSADPAKPNEPLTPHQVALALQAPEVTTLEELDQLLTRKEQELENKLGLSLFLFRQLAAEADRGDAAF